MRGSIKKFMAFLLVFILFGGIFTEAGIVTALADDELLLDEEAADTAVISGFEEMPADDTDREDENAVSDDDADLSGQDELNGGWCFIYDIKIYKGQKYDVAAKIKDRYTGTGKVAKYTVKEQRCTSEPGKAVATVDAKGIVNAKRLGSCVVYFSNKNGNELGTAAIDVIDKPYFVYNGAKNKLPTLTRKGKGFSASDYLSDIPEGCTCTYKSSKPKVASVSKSGAVVARKNGTTKITAVISGPEKYNKKFEVSANVKVKIPSISKKTLLLAPGKSGTVSIKNATGNVTWSQDEYRNVASARVDSKSSKKVHIKAGKNGGVTKLTAKCADGQVFTCTVVVKQLGKRYYSDVKLKGKYDEANAKKILSGLNAYRKSKGVPTLKTDAEISAIAAVNCRCEMASIPNYYSTDDVYSRFCKSKYKSFNAFRKVFKNNPKYKDINETFTSRSYKKAGCAVFYDINRKLYCTIISFE